jgi:hypothetical protein
MGCAIDSSKPGRGRARSSIAATMVTAVMAGLAGGAISCVGQANHESTEPIERVALDVDRAVIQQGGEDMRQSKIRTELEAANSDEAQEALAAELLEQAREPGNALVAFWQGSNPDLSEDAFAVLTELSESGIEPLLARESELEADDRVQALRLATEAEIALRQRILAVLDRMLDDRRPLTARPELSPMESAEPSMRVCDEAYIQIRKLVHFGEDELYAIVDADAYLDLPDEGRNEVIEKARRTETWNRLDLEASEN